ncbi:uncharacterized protein LOC116121615 [Pistacia vera]|uniref:uncharacterized protein LOC116121615 n=1 Tax=Pistacia vera TaxID=55513 RepID=UPI001262B149|nr:uncharacterized protein LOC116121615 [Pistacia vera]
MKNLTKLEFVALDITGKNYLSWILDAEIHLGAMGLGVTIKEGNESSNQDKAKAMFFLRHHLHEGLKTEYLTVKDPLTLWENLKESSPNKQNNELLRKNHEVRPIGSTPFPEVNVTISNNHGRGVRHGHGCGRGRGNGCGHGRGRGQSRNNHNCGGYNYNSSNYKSHQKWNNDEEKKEKGKSGQHKNSKNRENMC